MTENNRRILNEWFSNEGEEPGKTVRGDFYVDSASKYLNKDIFILNYETNTDDISGYANSVFDEVALCVFGKSVKLIDNQGFNSQTDDKSLFHDVYNKVIRIEIPKTFSLIIDKDNENIGASYSLSNQSWEKYKLENSNSVSI